MLKLGVLASGTGTNLQSIIDAIEAGELAAEIAVVLSDQPGAAALVRASEKNIPTELVTKTDHPMREDYDETAVGVLNKYGVELVILAGFMRIITPVFIKPFEGRIMNIHPALLPAFPGLNVQQMAIDYGVKFSGCTVHFVDEGVDTGPIILQKVVPVQGDDTEGKLSARILAEEHKAYVEAIKLYAEGKLTVEGRRVVVKGDE